MPSVELAGGSVADRDAVVALMHTYLTANAKFDWPTLEAEIWTAEPDAMFFNMNGHTYIGREHWVTLWKYYAVQAQSGTWVPYDIAGKIGPELAVLWSHRKTHMSWVGSDPRPDDPWHADKDFISRATMVFAKQPEGWRVVHVHFSEGGFKIGSEHHRWSVSRSRWPALQVGY